MGLPFGQRTLRGSARGVVEFGAVIPSVRSLPLVGGDPSSIARCGEEHHGVAGRSRERCGLLVEDGRAEPAGPQTVITVKPDSLTPRANADAAVDSVHAGQW
jgi:hypothetical protein